MDGIILFVDDEVFDNTVVNKFYLKLAEMHPVIAVKDLVTAENVIKSINKYLVVLIDWTFKETIEGINKNINPKSLLMNKFIYAPILIYSESATLVEGRDGKELKEVYNDKIKFKDKVSDIEKIESEVSSVLKIAHDWISDMETMKAIMEWSGAINEKTQLIFKELSNADENWMSDLFNTMWKEQFNFKEEINYSDDGPTIEIINIFQNLLSEKIIQDKNLIESIKTVAEKNKNNISGINPDSYSKLFHTFYYSSVTETDPIMTGDIFLLDKEKFEFGIIITPECDIRHCVKENPFEVLIFKKGDFKKYCKNEFKNELELKTQNCISIVKDLYGEDKNKERKLEIDFGAHLKSLKESLFNNKAESSLTQTIKRVHLLPGFKFGEVEEIAWIDFRMGRILIKRDELDGKRKLKLNTPFIQELRQRYYSYQGRIGVIAMPDILKKYNVKISK